MRKNVLLRTNLLVCAVILIGFIVTSCISYQSNQGIFRRDIESVSRLTSEGIYHQIDTIFTKPIHISTTMANDSLLKEFLDGEQQHLEDPAFTKTMREYLNTYREKYGYDSVFLASVETKRYYYFNGLDRVLSQQDPENTWFYQFLQQDEEYNIVIDNDQVTGADNEVTVFINCRIENESGQTAGIVGVGFRVNTLQSLLKSYENDFGVNAYLIDTGGNIEVTTDHTGFDGESNLFDHCDFAELRETILSERDQPQNLWFSSAHGNGYVVSRYIDNLGWYLVVENNTTQFTRGQTWQLVREILIVALIILLVLITITSVMRRYNRKIIELTQAAEKQHQRAFQQATEQLYENIYEFDLTHNRSASEATSHYFESLGAPPDIAYDKALRVIAQKQIKEEYRQGYIDTFDPAHVLQAFAAGRENLQYDFMITTDGTHYYWMRIIAHIFRWSEDGSVRMLVYRQNIDEQKRHELYMLEQMQRDSLTRMYNKVATQEHIRQLLEASPQGKFALFIFDIDHFKTVNDRLGHAAGDSALVSFARILRQQFLQEDIVGRIGGDEFIAFMPIAGRQTAQDKASALVRALQQKMETPTASLEITASIGVALAPKMGADFETLYKRADDALYQAKKKGRNGFVMAG